MLVPPDRVLNAFEKQYPNKKATWSMEVGMKEDDIKFEAKFYTGKTLEYALYDGQGVFKSYKTSLIFIKLPKNIQTYVNKNYPKWIKQSFSVLDDRNVKRYEIEVKKSSTNYNLIFDSEGNYLKKSIINAY